MAKQLTATGGDLRQQPSETAESFGSDLVPERRNKLVQLITKARVVSGQPQLDDLMMGLTVIAWHEALSMVPTASLDDFYLRALELKRDTFPLSALDILRAWNVREEYDRAQLPPEGYSFERNEHGKFIHLTGDPKRLPYGAQSEIEAVNIHAQKLRDFAQRGRTH